VVGAVASVIVGNDRFESRLLFVRSFHVVGLFLRQIFLKLPDVGHILFVSNPCITSNGLCGWGKDAGNVQWLEVAILCLPVRLHRSEQPVIGNGIVDGGRGKKSVELAPVGGGMVFLKDGFNDGFFGHGFTGLGLALAFGFEIVDVEAQDIVVFDGVGDGVGVQLLLEDLFRGFPGSLLPFNLLITGVFWKDGGAGKAGELGLREKILDRLVVLAKLRAVAFVKDKDNAFVAQRFQTLLEVALVAAIEGKTELLDGGNNHLVGIVIREQSLYQGFSVGVLFDTTLLKLVELLPRLPIKIFGVHHKETFVNIGVILEQS
jgi:hypothetical protein